MALLVVVGACSAGDAAVGPEDAGTPDALSPAQLDCPFDYDGYEPGPSPPTFSGDVMPLLQANCSNSVSCHARSMFGMPPLDFLLGPDLVGPETPVPTQEDLDAAHANLLADSLTVPAMKRVAPGDPESSFLMLKLDGCQDSAAAGLACEKQPGVFSFSPCGDRMPQAQKPLSEEERNVFRDWILAGAAND